MTLIEEADNMEVEKHKQKDKLEFIQQQADLEQDNFKKEYADLIEQFQEGEEIDGQTEGGKKLGMSTGFTGGTATRLTSGHGNR